MKVRCWAFFVPVIDDNDGRRSVLLLIVDR